MPGRFFLAEAQSKDSVNHYYRSVCASEERIALGHLYRVTVCQEASLFRPL
ncbi:protein of unknown function [Bradyrhizobium vignae]|uniref:Uncharacterized protein n=1 Tax=Bradyrhizobium vignae TaxID=1549949 RepID=A0A2U3PYZ7_9BRAD|nr:protein of unknown function [Bradyrhizobium vignae]